jgi:rubrerythrin
MHDLDLSTLTLQDALDFAILVEEEACDRYTDLARQMEAHNTQGAAEFFRFMVLNEAKHGRELTLRRFELFGTAPSRIDGSMVWDVEAPEFDEVRAFMPPRAALDVALRAEEKAYRFFAGALPHINDPQVHTLFEELMEEELVHQDLVRREIERLPAGADVEIEDFVDEPMPQ